MRRASDRARAHYDPPQCHIWPIGHISMHMRGTSEALRIRGGVCPPELATARPGLAPGPSSLAPVARGMPRTALTHRALRRANFPACLMRHSRVRRRLSRPEPARPSVGIDLLDGQVVAPVVFRSDVLPPDVNRVADVRCEQGGAVDLGDHSPRIAPGSAGSALPSTGS